MIQALSDALADRGYQSLTAVQEAVTKPELEGADLLVSAQTGSGKTVAFGLAIAATLLDRAEALGAPGSPLALVVAPTRELAIQVMRELSWLYAKAGARVVSCVGGMDMRQERQALERGAHIVVGTPGRLRDHIQRGSLDMTQLRAIVLDEADEMLDLGFREDLEFMLGEAPEGRRTLMFSATVPPPIVRLAQQYQRDAVRVTTVSSGGQHADIAYQAMRVAPIDAENAIINVLRYHDAQNAIVFANTRATVSRLGARLTNRGLSVVTLSGELSQKERTHALQAMRDGRARVCVATDVAARGIDLPNLELVVHAELPSNAEGLLHRSGRTGRAGRKGTSVLIVPPKAGRKAEGLLRAAQVEAEWIKAPSAEEILHRDEERLLNDPVWSEEIPEDLEASAARLLALHSPKRIAAAFLRLRRAGQSAPEELADPDAPPPPKERKPFGPSTWFALSVGHDDRAEARWLLPMILRAGRLDKGAIGAIRVKQSETFVEIAQGSVEGFLAALGQGGELDEGITVRKAEAPSSAPVRPAPGGHRKGPRSGKAEMDRSSASDDAPPAREFVPPEVSAQASGSGWSGYDEDGQRDAATSAGPKPRAKRAGSAQAQAGDNGEAAAAWKEAGVKPAWKKAGLKPKRAPGVAPSAPQGRAGRPRPGQGAGRPPKRGK